MTSTAVEAASSLQRSKRGSLLGLTQSSYDPASRFRFGQFVPHFERAGWLVTHRPNRPDRQWRSPLGWRPLRGPHYKLGRAAMWLNRWRDVGRAGEYDVVFMNRDLAGAGRRLESRLLGKNPRVIYDFDDAIFVGANEPSVRWMCTNAAHVTPGNDYLAAYASRYTDRVTVVPTVIDTDTYEVSPPPSTGPLRVGWSGSDQSIGATLYPCLPMLRELQRTTDFEVVIIANSRPTLPVEGLRWSFRPWRADDEGQIGRYLDVGIMPLLDDEFQRGKCGLKLLQYMAAGLPAIASPVGVNATIVDHGRSGLLASTHSEWAQAITMLASDPQRRRELGAIARRRCEEQYSVRRWLPVLVDLFERVRHS